MLLLAHARRGPTPPHPQSRLCHVSPQKRRPIPAHLPTAAGLVDDLQRVLLPRGPANQTSPPQPPGAAQWRSSDSSRANSPLHTLLDHSEVAVPDDFADLVLLVDEGGGNGAIAVHWEETGGWIKGSQKRRSYFYTSILKLFKRRAAEQSLFRLLNFCFAPSAATSSACSASPFTSVEEAPRGVYGEGEDLM